VKAEMKQKSAHNLGPRVLGGEVVSADVPCGWVWLWVGNLGTENGDGHRRFASHSPTRHYSHHTQTVTA